MKEADSIFVAAGREELFKREVRVKEILLSLGPIFRGHGHERRRLASGKA